MYPDISLTLSIVFVIVGLVALAWSSDLFVDGASILAKALGISPFIIGMVIIGFGTSAPELCVSAMSGVGGHPELSLGNAYGSCAFNIAVILGVAALIHPLVVKPAIVFVAAPVLTAISLFSLWILGDGDLTRPEAFVLLGVFALLMPAYCWFDQKKDEERVGVGVGGRVEVGGGVGVGGEGRVGGGVSGRGVPAASLSHSVSAASPRRGLLILKGALKTLVGLGMLVGSSHVLVWGAVDFAQWIGVSDLVIGLTVVAVGTSLPELASAIQSARRGEHEFVLGNIVGSNLFNTLGVVGLATAITPLVPGADGKCVFSPYILTRDLPVLAALSIMITLFGLNFRHPKSAGVITRGKAVVWILAFAAYSVVMFLQEVGK